MSISKGDVVQFTEKHKWSGCLGIVTDIRRTGTYTVAVEIPEHGTAYIFAGPNDIEYIGPAHLVPAEVNE